MAKTLTKRTRVAPRDLQTPTARARLTPRGKPYEVELSISATAPRRAAPAPG